VTIAMVLFASVCLAESRPPEYRAEGFHYTEPAAAKVSQLALQKPDVVLEAPAHQTLSSDPPQNGIVRALPQPFEVGRGNRIAAAGDALAVFRSAGAMRVRLHLTQPQFPAGAQLTVSGFDGKAVTFSTDLLMPDGSLWTPSVGGDTIALTFPGTSSFVVTDVAHIFGGGPASNATDCFTDVACNSFPDKAALSSAVAQVTFINGASTFVCTGGLINGASGDRLLLTANHCINTQAEATSLEADFDYTAPSCGSTAQPNDKRIVGSTLLVASETTDVALVRLPSLPPGRTLMGWTTTRPVTGTTLYRISHPYDGTSGLFKQNYSTTTVDETTGTCGSAPRPSFLYSVKVTGGIEGGSSGSPVIIEGGFIVGQLLGLCGPSPLDGCSTSAHLVDGSIGQSYAQLQPFINPTQGSQCGSCVAGTNTACALGGRFKITISWNDTGAHLTGAGTVIHYADNLPAVDPTLGPVSESVFFSFYPFAPKDVEALVRLINGHGINDKYWVFATGFTGAQYTVNVQDMHTCATWQHNVPGGATDVVKDFNAFPLP
jgi:hypothetical protein